MECCSVNGLDRIFNKSRARKESNSYLKKGLDKRARKLADFLKGESLSEATLLDVGCGVGGLHLELLKHGAGKAIGVDVSPAYVEAASSLARELGSNHFRMSLNTTWGTSLSKSEISPLLTSCCSTGSSAATPTWSRW